MYDVKWVPYHYYSTPDAPARLCEVSEKGYVFMFHDESCRPKSAYAGRFVRLIEATADAVADLVLENSLAADEAVSIPVDTEGKKA